MLHKNLIALYTLLRREVIRIIRIWPQTILPPIITTSLYLIIFGNLIGNRIGAMQGASYIQYIIPGLIIMSMITNAYANVASSFFVSKFQRNIEEILISPMYNTTIILGFIGGGIFRGLMVGCLVIVVAAFFAELSFYNVTVTIFIAALTTILFSLAGIVNGIFARKFDDISTISTFVLTPLTYLGGVFYTINLLPSCWQKITLINPIFYLVNGFRYGMLGKSDVSILSVFIILISFVLVLYALCIWLLHKGIGLRE